MQQRIYALKTNEQCKKLLKAQDSYYTEMFAKEIPADHYVLKGNFSRGTYVEFLMPEISAWFLSGKISAQKMPSFQEASHFDRPASFSLESFLLFCSFMY
jgi:hypothetical protein